MMDYVNGINEGLKDKVKELNSLLKKKYGRVLSLPKKELKEFIKNNIGEIETFSALDKTKLKQLEKNGGLLGVDGSVNRVGGLKPHYVDLFQGLAVSTIKSNEVVILSEISTPLLEDEDENDNEGNIRDRLLSDIELKSAIEGIKKCKPAVVMMDGSLLRYKIISPDLWEKLRSLAEEQEVSLMGVIKDIKTSIISDKMIELGRDWQAVSDRELLFGLLEIGEGILIFDEENRKKKSGFSSAFLRSSLAPTVIGIDVLDSQRSDLEKLVKLTLALTPQTSRGVPLWLDMVDSQVKLSDKMLKATMETYLDRDYYERFFISERNRRTKI